MAQPYWQANILHFYYPSHTYVVLSYEFSFFPQTTFARYPSRIRHNGDKGADVQQGPAQRFLFRLSPCVNLLYCLLLLTYPMGTIPTEDTAVIGISPRQINARTWKHRVYNEWAFLSPSSVIKSEYLRECSASRVWPYMHQLRIMSLVKCWVCPAPGFAALRSVLIG